MKFCMKYLNVYILQVEVLLCRLMAPWCSGNCIHHRSIGRWFEALPSQTKDFNSGTTETLG